MKNRTAALERNTTETKISAAIDLDGTGANSIRTGMPFLDHMLQLLSRHSLIDLTLKAAGDLAVDYHLLRRFAVAQSAEHGWTRSDRFLRMCRMVFQIGRIC